jgi:hypothetical protein
MLNEDYNCLDYFKFYYNIKMEYKPTDRSCIKPFLLILGVLFTVLTSHGLVIPKDSHDILFFSITGGFYVILIGLGLSMMGTPKTIATPKDYK